MIAEFTIFVLLCAVANRVRGTTAIGVWPYAYIIASAFGLNWWIFFGFVLGEATGWGAPLGAVLQRRPQGNDKEKWQILRLNEKPQLSLVLRGLWYGLVPASLGHFSGYVGAWHLLPAIAIPFIVAPYIGREIPEAWLKNTKLTAWRVSEFIGGGLTGALIYTLNKGALA